LTRATPGFFSVGWRKGKQHGFALVYGMNTTDNSIIMLTEWSMGKLVEGSTFAYSFHMWRIFQGIHSLGFEKLEPIRMDSAGTGMFDVR
jgi:hypothetical protein